MGLVSWAWLSEEGVYRKHGPQHHRQWGKPNTALTAASPSGYYSAFANSCQQPLLIRRTKTMKIKTGIKAGPTVIIKGGGH